MGPGRPPIDFGRPKPAYPASARAACQRLARRTTSASAAFGGGTNCGPVLRIQARTSARKAASVGVSSKSKVVSLPVPMSPQSLCRPSPYVAPAPMAPECLRLPRQLCRDTVLPFPQCAEHHSKVLGASVEKMAIMRPGHADAAMDLDQLPRGSLQRLRRGDTGGRGRERERRGVRLERPGSVETVGTRQFDRDENVSQLVL